MKGGSPEPNQLADNESKESVYEHKFNQASDGSLIAKASATNQVKIMGEPSEQHRSSFSNQDYS